MKAKVLLIATLAALLAFGFAGCQKARTDAQVSADVQSKIAADPALQSRQYDIATSNGVVTLAGTVTSDAERNAAASDAAQAEGVKTVVNNLQVAPPASTPPPEQQATVTPSPAETQNTSPAKRAKSSGFRRAQHSDVQGSNSASNAPAQNLSTPVNQAANNTVPAVPPPPPPPPKPVEVTVPEGTALSIRLIDPIDSEKNQAGDHFRATLDSAVSLDDKVAIPAGADISGRVTNVKSAAHFSGRSELALELTRVSFNGKSYDLHTDQFSKQGVARGKNTAEKVGGGAVLGTLIGAIAGGGKGAAIGGAIGAGAGGTAQAATHGQEIRLTSEQVLAFHLESPLTVTPSARTDRNSGRQRLDTNTPAESGDVPTH